MVCPTDGMEQLIRKKFEGEAFFYTALGLYFEFEIQSENDLWQLIVNNSVKQVVFVSSIKNVFYSDAFARNRKQCYSIDEALDKTLKSNIKHPSFVPNIHLLAAKHLENQKQRLLSTGYLGYQIVQAGIPVEAYVYKPQTKSFCSLNEVNARGSLLNDFCAN